MPPGKVVLGSEDVTELIRSSAVTESSRFIADSPSVRRRLTAWQQEFAATENVVTEGRDQGTLVFPDAFRKYYLTASEEERARRRLADYAQRQEPLDFEAVLEEIRARDARDAARAIAPMKPAADAIVVDSTGLTIEEVVERLAADVQSGVREDGLREERGGNAPEAVGECPPVGSAAAPREQAPREEPIRRDRSRGSLIWYRFVQCVCASLALCVMRWRAKGRVIFLPPAECFWSAIT